MEKTRKKRKRNSIQIVAEVASKYGISVPIVQDQERTLSPNEIAPIFGVTGEAVKHWIYQRRLPAVKQMNGYWRVKVSDLERFIQARSEVGKQYILVAARAEVAGITAEALKILAHNSVVASNLSDALLKAQSIRPSLLLIDTGWSEGWKLLQKVRSYKPLRNVPIILTSPKPLSVEELDGAMKTEVAGCLVEPFDAKILAAEIDRGFTVTPHQAHHDGIFFVDGGEQAVQTAAKSFVTDIGIVDGHIDLGADLAVGWVVAEFQQDVLHVQFHQAL